MKFISYFDRLCPSTKTKVPEFNSVVGSRFMPTYQYDVVDGVKTLVESGEVDLQAEIDSYADAQDINNIIARFLNGDTSVINPKSGTYGDFTNVPETYAELFSRVQHCENVFNSLPVDIREKFDNSYQKFWSDFGSSEFDAVFDEYNSQFGKQDAEGVGISEDVKTPVKESEVSDAK